MKINEVTTTIYNNYYQKNKLQKCSKPNIIFKAKANLKFTEINDLSRLSDTNKLINMITLAKNEVPNFIKKNIKIRFFEYLDKAMAYIGINKNSIDLENLQNEYMIIGEANFIQQNSAFFARLVGAENKNRPGYSVFYNDIFNPQTSSINRQLVSKKIGKYNENLIFEYGKHNGALNFIHRNIMFFEDIIGVQNVSNNNLPLQEEIKNIEGEELRKKYHELIKELRELRKTESTMNQEEIKNLNEKEELARKYYREIARKNISIVEIKEFSTDPTQDVEAKKEYLRQLTDCYVVNEASQKDCLDMYEKYGFRYWIREIGDQSFIRDLSLIATPCKFSDGEYLMRRYLDIAERTTKRDPLGMRDGSKVMVMYEMYGNEYGEDITLRFINLMKKISFQQLDAEVFDIYTREKSTPAIKKAIEELKEITKDFPEVDRFKNT